MLFEIDTAGAVAPTEVTYNNSQTMPLLRAALHSDPNPSKGGGEITIDHDALLADVGPTGSLADIEERPLASDQISIYVVREGDTLSQIGVMFNVSVNTIRWANDLSRNEAIQPGQTLVVLPISGVRHTVVKGDTLQTIAKEYKADLDEILSFNNLHADMALVVGEVIVVPDGEIGAPAPMQATPRVATGGGSSSGSASGYFINPVPGSVRTQGIHGYNGVDLGARSGTQVISAAGGEVLISRASGWNGGYGIYIVVKHDNGTQTLYAHLNQAIVYAGQRVVQGQVIGYVGATGRATGPHLHFEVRGASNPF
ncbi:MAG TPA: peptidoglycan DD-metalloendopeptidase family protein [Candidatus Paceibacterota bacterium]